MDDGLDVAFLGLEHLHLNLALLGCHAGLFHFVFDEHQVAVDGLAEPVERTRFPLADHQADRTLAHQVLQTLRHDVDALLGQPGDQVAPDHTEKGQKQTRPQDDRLDRRRLSRLAQGMQEQVQTHPDPEEQENDSRSAAKFNHSRAPPQFP